MSIVGFGGGNQVLDLGFQELILIFIVALLVFGPKKLPELSRSLGKGIRELKMAMRGIKESVEETETQIEENIAEEIPRDIPDKEKKTENTQPRTKPNTSEITEEEKNKDT